MNQIALVIVDTEAAAAEGIGLINHAITVVIAINC